MKLFLWENYIVLTKFYLEAFVRKIYNFEDCTWLGKSLVSKKGSVTFVIVETTVICQT